MIKAVNSLLKGFKLDKLNVLTHKTTVLVKYCKNIEIKNTPFDNLANLYSHFLYNIINNHKINNNYY